jgi:hypothetical protein
LWLCPSLFCKSAGAFRIIEGKILCDLGNQTFLRHTLILLGTWSKGLGWTYQFLLVQSQFWILSLLFASSSFIIFHPHPAGCISNFLLVSSRDEFFLVKSPFFTGFSNNPTFVG